MSAQEFSSPGEHMASQTTNSGVSIAYRNPNIIESDNVSFGPPVYYGGPNNGGSSNVGTIHHSARDIDDFFRYSKQYNDYYMKYNTDLFNSAKDYDMYMSNTAIQRQVEDLKKAGINPILAGRLGGAAYKGVSAPYISINPSGTLSALTGLAGSYLNYDAKMSEISSNERISENEIKARAENLEKELAHKLYTTNLTLANTLQIARENNLTNTQIAELESTYKVKVQELYNECWREVSDKQLDSQKEIANNSNIISLLNNGINAIKSSIQTFIIVSHYNNRNKPDGNGSVGVNTDRSRYGRAIADTIGAAGASSAIFGGLSAVPIF